MKLCLTNRLVQLLFRRRGLLGSCTKAIKLSIKLYYPSLLRIKTTVNKFQFQMLVNRYRERKALSENIGKLIALVEQADEIAKSAKELVESKTNIQGEINELLAIPDEIVQLNTLKVDTDLEGIAPPCLPFQMEFTVNTKQPTNHEGVYRICFNGEFYKNVVLRVMKVKYPSVDEMYKALEEAELRYAQIGAIRKSLKVVEDEVHSSKRGQVPLPKEEDPVERMLSKIAKRRIPKFTLKGDRTVLAFHHYSPWATIKRSHPFEVEGEPSFQTKYNASRIHGTYTEYFICSYLVGQNSAAFCISSH